MLEEELVQVLDDKIKGRRYLKFKACNSDGIGSSGNHIYFFCLEENCFCEFDNNSWSLQKRNDHNCGDPKYKFLMTNRNIPVVMEVEIKNVADKEAEVVLDEDFFLSKIMDPCCYFLAESGSAFRVAEYWSFRNMRKNDLSALNRHAFPAEVERMLKRVHGHSVRDRMIVLRKMGTLSMCKGQRPYMVFWTDWIIMVIILYL
jgi:hypothetical protein